MQVVIETFLNPGEPSSKRIRARPVAGQKGYSTRVRVSCSTAMRNKYPVGSRFLLEVRWIEPKVGSRYLYAQPYAKYRKLDPGEVARFLRTKAGTDASSARSRASKSGSSHRDDGWTVEAATISALEGQLQEARLLTRGRSASLRRKALEASGGVCAACRTDFGSLLDGRGWSALHVHHLHPLSSRKLPSATKLADLAVVCANCHALLHSTRGQLLAVAALRRSLRRSR